MQTMRRMIQIAVEESGKESAATRQLLEDLEGSGLNPTLYRPENHLFDALRQEAQSEKLIGVTSRSDLPLVTVRDHGSMMMAFVAPSGEEREQIIAYALGRPLPEAAVDTTRTANSAI
jgi:hypothetical protein